MFIFVACTAIVAYVAATPSAGAPSGQGSAASVTAVPMTFVQAVDEAQAHNVSAEVARRAVSRAAGLLEVARAASLPMLAGQAGLVQLNAQRVQKGVLIAGQRQENAALNLSLPLVSPRTWGNWREADTAMTVAWAADANVRRQVAIATARAYLAVITQTNIVAVDQAAVENDRGHYDYALARFMGGVGNRLDQLRAGQQLANSHVQLENALTAQMQAREALGILVGRDTPVDVGDDMPLEPAGPLFDALKNAEHLRADVRYVQLTLSQAQQVRRQTWLDFAPSLVGMGSLAYSHPGTPSVPLHSWELQLVLQVPIYDGGARYGAITLREAATGQAQVQLAYSVRAAHAEVRAAYQAVQHADTALVSAREAAALAAEALQLADVAYHAGTTGNLEVIDAERVNRDAQTGAIVASDSLRQARLDLVTAAGHFP